MLFRYYYSLNRNECSIRLSATVIKDHVTRLRLIFKRGFCKLRWTIGNTMRLFKSWKPKGKMYSLKCNQCGEGFLSSYQLEAPICGKCLQKVKSLDSTIEHEKQCLTCGAQGVIYRKEYCYSCYFGFGKKQREWIPKLWRRGVITLQLKILLMNRKYFESLVISLREVETLKVSSHFFDPLWQRPF